MIMAAVFTSFVIRFVIIPTQLHSEALNLIHEGHFLFVIFYSNICKGKWDRIVFCMAQPGSLKEKEK